LFWFEDEAFCGEGELLWVEEAAFRGADDVDAE